MTDMGLLNAIGELFNENFEEKIALGFRAMGERLDKVENVIRRITKNWKLHKQILTHGKV